MGERVRWVSRARSAAVPGVAVVAMLALSGRQRAGGDAGLDAGQLAERERRSAGQLPGRC
jgi:hypothetical protein